MRHLVVERAEVEVRLPREAQATRSVAEIADLMVVTLLLLHHLHHQIFIVAMKEMGEGVHLIAVVVRMNDTMAPHIHLIVTLDAMMEVEIHLVEPPIEVVMNENTREVVLLLHPPLLEIVNTALVEADETILVLRNHPFEAKEVEEVVVVAMQVEVES